MKSFRKPILIVGLGVAFSIGLSLLIAVFLGGWIRHGLFMATWESRGVTFDVAPFQKAIPPNLDFTQAPVIADWMGYEEGSERSVPRVYRFIDKIKVGDAISYDRSEGTISSNENPGQHLERLGDQYAILRELHEAVLRPAATTEYLIQMGRLNEFQKDLCHYAYLQCAAGEFEAGLQNLTTAVRLPGRISESSATLVPLLVELAMLKIASDTIWAALQLDGWDEESLSRLEAECRRIELAANLPQTVIKMIAFDEAVFRAELTQNAGDPIEAFFVENFVLHHLVTSHAMFANPVLWDEEQKKVLTGFDLQAAIRLQDRAMELRERPEIIRMFTAVTVPNIGRLGESILEVQQLYQMAVIACSLKRYDLKSGAYPESLDLLNDVVLTDLYREGLPLLYRRDEEDGFVLYSVGMDGSDDGGNLQKDLVWSMSQ